MRKSVATLALGAFLLACAPKPPVEIDAASVEPKLYWSRSLQDQRVALTGYINFDNGPAGQAIAGGPELRSGANGAGLKLISFDAKFGSRPNQIGSATMKTDKMFKNAPSGVPEVVTFDRNALTYYDAKGAPHPVGQPARVIGRVKYAVSIENDPRSPTGQRFRPILTQVELAPGY